VKRVGIIGCGNIAQVHAWVLQEMEQAELSAVCDIVKEKAVSLSEKYADGREKVYTDWMELCLAEVDVVHVCTPHHLHVPMALEALKQGKAVLMEKPCAINREEFEQLKEMEGRKPGKLGFCFQNRYNDTSLLMNDLISQGVIGELTGGRAFVTWRRDEAYYEGSDWKGKSGTEGGGALINQSIHTLDLLLHFLGVPKQVQATMSNHHLKGKISVEDTVEAWMEFADGKRACFYASNGYVTDAPVILELQGTGGRITMNGPEVAVWTPDEGSRHILCEQKDGIGKGYWGCGHEACINDFYRCLEQKETFQGNIAGVENTFDTMMKIYEAAGGK